jgi:transcriptional regulator with XRE-family HTH domain
MLLIDEILTRIKKYLGTEVDAEIARALNVSPQRLSNWPKKGSTYFLLSASQQYVYIFLTLINALFILSFETKQQTIFDPQDLPILTSGYAPRE